MYFWSIFVYVSKVQNIALISSKLQKCGNTVCYKYLDPNNKYCRKMKIKKFCLVLQPVLGILYREIKNRARNEKIYKTNSRLQFNSDSLNNIWEFLQKGAKNWVQHFFQKNVSARVLHDFRDLNFVTRFIVFLL